MVNQTGNIVSVPVAVARDNFKWMIQFFDYQHRKIYGEKATSKSVILIQKRNFRHDVKVESVDWNLTLPYKMVDSAYDMEYNLPDGDRYMAVNLFTAITHVINDLNDEDYIEILDGDMCHIRSFNSVLPKDNEINADSAYENWHLFNNSKNRYVIEKYLKHSEEGYMNGGFNALSKVKVMKQLLPEIIDVAIDIVKTSPNHLHRWWSCMYALNVACHNQRIKMISRDDCYYPREGDILTDNMHLAHYSCDPVFDKRKFPNININGFKDNIFYNSAKEWMLLNKYIIQ